jgi:hypothetical protein
MTVINSSLPSTGFWARLSSSIPAGTSIDVDTVPLSGFSSTKYYVQLKNPTNTAFKAFEIYCFRKGSSDVSDTLYARAGDALDVATSVIVSMGNVKLSLTNNEAFTVSCEVIKLKH